MLERLALVFLSPGRGKIFRVQGLGEEGTDRILGAHLHGGRAEEVINLFALAMRSGTHVADLEDMLFAYPTHGSDVPYLL